MNLFLIAEFFYFLFQEKTIFLYAKSYENLLVCSPSPDWGENNSRERINQRLEQRQTNLSNFKLVT